MALDFMIVSTRSSKRGNIEIYPKFIIKKSSDLMIRGGDFYAIWVEELGLWSTDEEVAMQLIDREIDKYAEEHRPSMDANVRVMHMWDAETRLISTWHTYCQKDMRDNYHSLDENIIFSNTKTTKKDYASKRLPYPLENCPIPAYNKLMSTLYSPGERHKIEWAIGSIVTGDSKKVEKFLVLYGPPGAGKGTVLKIIFQLFEGYCATFEAKALGSAGNQFALEAFRSNPLVAIQTDGDLSRIEDNSRLNSLVSHEMMTVNEKFKSSYTNAFKAFLFMGTNKPVKITDAKSGILRRLIDVQPSGNKIERSEYYQLLKQIEFELGGIASYCRDLYLADPQAYDSYVPMAMLDASNDFYNFMSDSFSVFKKQDEATLEQAWGMYKLYCQDANVGYPLPRRAFKEELKEYFDEFYPIGPDGTTSNLYSGFREGRFKEAKKTIKDMIKRKENNSNIIFTEQPSFFDSFAMDMPAQLADGDKPRTKWDKVTTKLKDIDTSQVHYVKVPINHIVIDFDIPDETGEKCFEKNLEEASKWPPTYAELSKSGAGIHLHYIYTGDPEQLQSIYAPHIEIKVFKGNSSLRRKLTKCNNLPISSISSGLPLKEGGKKLVDDKVIKTEKGLRNMIMRNLNKEIHPYTKPSICFINDILNDAYLRDVHYDVSDLKPKVMQFAMRSHNNAAFCINLVKGMRFKSKDAVLEEKPEEPQQEEDERIIFYDVEVFPNLFIVNWKYRGIPGVTRMINPEPKDIEMLKGKRLVGYNCRRYDNHIMYARMMGYTNEQLFTLSKRIINEQGKDAFFSEAYNFSYTDIYDYAATKQSLKKWEIQLGIHHQELGLPWDQPVPEELWEKVAEYCDNDVIATEAVFEATQGDFTARKILAKIAGGTPNDTTNSLTTKIIFGSDRHPELVYTDLAETFPGYEFTIDENGKRHNMYRGDDLGFGGYVYAEPGMYGNVALLDIASMHPNSAVNLNYFGKYTPRFKELLDLRILIKHKDYEKAKQMMNGEFAEFLTDPSTAKQLAQALKIAINSVYGLTSATFENPFKDARNVNNIVALRGALFMRTLQDEVQKRGFTVAHIKTDSIKIPDATPGIISFCMDFAKQYGYTFEHEATYDRMCLVNDAVYIAKYADGEHEFELPTGEKIMTPWTATGTQFQIPYVFKTLFAKKELNFKDYCETKQVTSSLYLDMNEDNPEEHSYHFVGRIGQFCPMKPGTGGGLLMRETNGKYNSATGAKGYRWMESEVVKSLGKEDCIDDSYYISLATDARDAISKYGDYDWFVSDDPYEPAEIPFY